MSKGKSFLCFILVCCFLLCGMQVSAYDGVERDDDGNISYVPFEQGVHSDGGYTVEKVSHPTLGSGEIDGILTGQDQDRGNSYCWSAAAYGDYVYIGTCYNSTYYIYHNNVATAIKKMQSNGVIDASVDADKLANDIVNVAFGVDKFDNTKMNDWAPVIIAVNIHTGESQLIFKERDVWNEHPEIFPGYSPLMPVKNYLSGYRMAFEYKDKLYFAGMGSPTATLVEVDPETNKTNIVYYNINYTRGVSCGVHGLLVYDDEILMCLATDNYDGNGTPGGIIVASSNPGAGLSEWRVIADQDDFDGLPAVMQTDGLNGGGVWDIIEYNGSLYVTVVTDKAIDGKINKQGFAMYRGEKRADGSFDWTQVIGDHGTSGYGFGLGIDYSMSCNLWVYNNHLYLGTYNDPMLDLAEVPATGNFELLYHDLDHSIYLYRMDENENFEQIGGKADNPYFPEGPIGNLGAGLGNNSNQYVWRYGVYNDELYIGTYDTSTLTYMFTQITDGQVANMDYEDISGRADSLKQAVLEVLQEEENPYLDWILEQTIFSDYMSGLYQKLCGFATEMSADKNPVPDYEAMLVDYEKFKETVYKFLDGQLSSEDFLATYQDVTGVVTYADPETAPASFVDDLKDYIKQNVDRVFEAIDKAVYDKLIHNFVYYFGVNYYAQQCENGFDLLVSNDGVNFDAITRDGLGDYSNHGLRVICPTDKGLFLGTANPYYGAQLWRLTDGTENAEEIYTLSFETNGGTVVYAVEGKSDTVIDLTEHVATKEGYIFDGWYKDEALTERLTSVILAENTTIYAKWIEDDNPEKPELYTLSFETNGGAALDAVKAESDTVIDLSQYVATKEGYFFDGWYKDEGLTERLTSVTLTEDTTIYAKWTEDDNPEKPDEPQDPSKPEEPSNPSKPEKPSNPSKPEQSSSQSKSDAKETTRSSSETIATTDSVATGDQANIALWMVTSVMSSALIAAMIFCKKSGKYE